MKLLFKYIFLLGIVFFVSCGKNIENEKKDNTNEELIENTENKDVAKKTPYEQIHDLLANLESYEAYAKITYISNKGVNEYMTNQKALKSGEYKIEVIGPEDISGTITVFDGNVIYQYNPKNSGSITMNTEDTKERNELFLTTFIYNYFKSMESAVLVSAINNNDDVTILETTIPGNNNYFNTQKLFVDNNTLDVQKLVIYDKKGAERIVVTYEQIIYNQKFNSNEFEILDN